MNILGIHSSFSGLSHDSSAALVVNGSVVAAVEEERISRRKSSISYPPTNAIRECLSSAALDINDIDLIAADGVTFPGMDRKVDNLLQFEFGGSTFSDKISVYPQPDCHLWGAFLSSGYKTAISIDIEGTGDKVSSKVIAISESIDELMPLQNLFSASIKQFGRYYYLELYEAGEEHSLGILYGAFTQYLGFELIEGEYKVMGMAAYGQVTRDFSHLLSFNEAKGCLEGNIFEYVSRSARHSLQEPSYRKSEMLRLVKIPNRAKGAKIKQEHFDLAADVQNHFEIIYKNLVLHFVKLTGINSVCMSGGCALNAKANSLLADSGLISQLYVMPASSDRGVSLGAALLAAEMLSDNPPPIKNMFLGRNWEEMEIVRELQNCGLSFTKEVNWVDRLSEDIVRGKVIGLHHGRAEFGPRALGNRSILADPTQVGMKNKLNSKIKFREEYRPFAPAILESDSSGIVKKGVDYRSMTVNANVPEFAKLAFGDSCHVDGSARIQTVSDDNSNLFNILSAMKSKSSFAFPCIINTSFNLRGEPIVHSPMDALRTFFSSGLDVLYFGSLRIKK